MSVVGYAKCEQCGRMVTAVVWFPSAHDPRKQVCHDCHAKLVAMTPGLQKLKLGLGASADCPYKVPAPTQATPNRSQATVKHYLMPAGCEYRFLFTLWRVHRGLPEPLRNRVVAPELVSEAVAR